MKKYNCWFCGKLLENTGEKYLFRLASFVLRCYNHGKYFIDFGGFENKYKEGLIESLEIFEVFDKEWFIARDSTFPLYYFYLPYNAMYTFLNGDEIEFFDFSLNDQPEIIAERIKKKINTLITFS